MNFRSKDKQAIIPVLFLGAAMGSLRAQTVYEGFDYADDTPLAGLNGGTGFSSAWVTNNGTGPELAVNAGTGLTDNGLVAANLQTSGGHLDRSANTNFTTSNRILDSASVTTLTTDGTTMWGSFLYRDGIVAGNNADSSLTIASVPSALANNHDLSAAGYGFGLSIGEEGILTGGMSFENDVQQVFGPTTLTDVEVLDATSLFVFSVEWNEAGTPDVLSFYWVTNVNDPLPTAFSTQTFDFDATIQASLNTLSLVEAQGGEFDEIRLGTTLESVIPATALAQPTLIASDEFIDSGDSVTLDIVFDPSADVATLSTPDGDVNLLTLDDGSTNGDSVAGDGIVSYPDTPTNESNSYALTTSLTGGVVLEANVVIMVSDFVVPTNAFSSAILADMPLFYYRFEEPLDEGALYDSSGNTYHTTDIVGSLGQGNPPIPGGMQSAGEFPDDVGILVTGPTTNVSEAYTLVAVVNSNDLQAGAENLFSMSTGIGTGRSIFGLNNGNFETFTGGEAISIPVTTLPESKTTFLVHCVFVPDAVNTAIDSPTGAPRVSGEMRLYFDGSLQGSAAIETEINEGEWVLGSHRLRGFNFFEGFMDEVAVFESALTDSQIAAHGSAFFATADPLLGFAANPLIVESDSGGELIWKISDQATSVEINGEVQTISGGGLYSTPFANLTGPTNYEIEVFFAGGSVTSEVNITVVAPSQDPVITLVFVDNDAEPPSVTLEMQGSAMSSYTLSGSADLQDGFPEDLPNISTDSSGFGSVTFDKFGDREFYRVVENQ